MKEINRNEIKKIIADTIADINYFDAYAVRTTTANTAKKIVYERSYIWENNIASDEQLDGICATALTRFGQSDIDEALIENALELSKHYFGTKYFILGEAGRDTDRDLDEQEILLKNIKIIGKIID